MTSDALSAVSRSHFTIDRASQKTSPIWVEPTRENAAATHRALAAFGAPLDKLGPEDLAQQDVVFQIGVAPLRVDIMTSITGIDFGEAWNSRATASYGRATVNVLGLDSLVANKRATGRLQDLADLERLEFE